MTSFLILSISNICLVLSPCDDYWLSKSFLCNRQISQPPLAPLLCSLLRSNGCYIITQLPPHVFHVLCAFLTPSKWTLASCSAAVFHIHPSTCFWDQINKRTFQTLILNVSVTKSNCVIIYSHPHVVSNVFFPWNTKGEILRKYYGKWAFFTNSYFGFHGRIKEIHTGWNMRVHFPFFLFLSHVCLCYAL